MFGAEVARRILSRLSNPATSRTAEAFPALNSRERKVLEGMVDGLRPRAIGHHLGVSEKTVRNNISTVLAKLHAADRSEAVQIARDFGLGEPRPPKP